MLFWILCSLIALAVAVLMARPLLRQTAVGDAEEESRSEVALYRDQLAEIDRDIARGVLTEDEAIRTRTEVARRLLAADAAAPPPRAEAPRRATLVTAALSVLVVAGGGTALYLALGAADLSGPYPDLPRAERIAQSAAIRADRPSQAAMMATRMAAEPAIEPEGEVAEIVARLRAAVPEAGDDAEGWLWLAQTEAGLGNWPAAVAAMDEVVRIVGDEGPNARAARTDLLDLMVRATAGYVSPEAEALAAGLLERDPDNPAARAYLGLLYFETDRPDLAFRLWRPLAEDPDQTGFHARVARTYVAEAAFRAGLDYPLPTALAAPGPDAADIAATADMAPEDRAAMARGMVEGLGARLASEGGTAAEWSRLITSLAVLGDTDRARAIAAEARAVFARAPNDIARIEAAIAEAGLE